MRIHMSSDVGETETKLYHGWEEQHCVKIWLGETELQAIAGRAKEHGISDVRYVYRLLEYGMRDDSWLDDGKPGVLPGRRKRV